MILDFVRLYDAVPLEPSEARLYFSSPSGVTTTLMASETCKLERDDLGCIHVRLGRKVEDRVEWRAKVILLGPGMWKFAEYADAQEATTAPVPVELLRATGTDPDFRHPKAKRR